jgi:peroxisomal 2,4-dienoyl-CoA reductase
MEYSVRFRLDGDALLCFAVPRFHRPRIATLTDLCYLDNKVVLCTGGAGTICSAQVRAMVHLGANACIIGRNVEKTENMAKDIATARKGSKVLGLGGVDVRKPEALQEAATKCAKELGSIDFVM